MIRSRPTRLTFLDIMFTPFEATPPSRVSCQSVKRPFFFGRSHWPASSLADHPCRWAVSLARPPDHRDVVGFGRGLWDGCVRTKHSGRKAPPGTPSAPRGSSSGPSPRNGTLIASPLSPRCATGLGVIVLFFFLCFGLVTGYRWMCRSVIFPFTLDARRRSVPGLFFHPNSLSLNC